MRILRRRAFTLLLALILVVIVGMSVMSLLGQTTHQHRSLRRHTVRQLEFTAAEAALNKTYAEIRFLLESGISDLTSDLSTITAPNLEDIAYLDFSVTQTDSAYEMVTSGPFNGLNLHTLTFRAEATARYTGSDASLLSRPGASIQQDFKVRYIPLYVFGIFYDGDLEIGPGADYVQSGRVHTNSNLYYEAGTTAHYLSAVTAHGNILHEMHPDYGFGAVDDGDVLFWDGTQSVSAQVGGEWVDHNHPDWAEEALDLWDGWVLDSTHGMPELPLPISSDTDSRALIEPADAGDSLGVAALKLENKAGLVIEVDPDTFVVSAHDADDFGVDLTYDHDSNPGTAPIPVYEFNTFRDNREGHNVTTLDLHMDLLIDAGIAPSNGVLYVNAENGLRLINGAELPTNLLGGFTVATNGPAYVLGDYNTVDTKLSLIAADAYNQLSNNWNDANSTLSVNSRVATETTVKTVVMAGNVPTDSDTPYSGGVENYFRFHEKWSGRAFNFAGSIINLWESQIATGDWSYGDPVYTAPIRLWDWDSIYGGINGPPGMPRVFFLDRLEWQETVAQS
jgi:hypothetical protein